MEVHLQQVPQTLRTVVINSSDTSAIEVVSAVSGKTVKIWGVTLTGGTSILFGSNSTALTGAIATTGLLLPIPRGNRADGAYPYFRSNAGETILITPGASGLKGIVYFTQDD